MHMYIKPIKHPDICTVKVHTQGITYLGLYLSCINLSHCLISLLLVCQISSYV